MDKIYFTIVSAMKKLGLTRKDITTSLKEHTSIKGYTFLDKEYEDNVYSKNI